MLKRTYQLVITVSLILGALLFFLWPENDEPTEINLSMDRAEVTVGDVFDITVSTNLEFVNLISSDFDVVRQVPNGWQALSPGTAIITVSSQDGQVQTRLTVRVINDEVRDPIEDAEPLLVTLDGIAIELDEPILVGGLDAPLKDGANFLGWALTPDGTVLDADTLIDESTALFAVFEVIEIEEPVVPETPPTEESSDEETEEDEEPAAESVTPPAVYMVSVISEMGHTLAAIKVSEGSIISPSDFALTESSIGYFKPGQTCDDPHDFTQTIENDTVLIYGELNFMSPCIELDEMAVTGDLAVGETLKAYVSPSAATVHYEWLMSDDNRDYYFLRQFTDSSITLLPEHHRMYIAIKLTGTGDYQGVLRLPLGRISLNQQSVDRNQLLISSWEDLANIPTGSESVGKTFVLTQNLDQNSPGYNTYASATANDGEGWTPLGEESSPFQGSFNGSGHTISDLKINTSSGDQGLFGYFEGNVSLKNLTLKDIQIISSEDDVGGIVSYIKEYSNVLIENILITGTSLVNGNDEVGSLVGQTNGRLIIRNIKNYANVSGEDRAGGLVGETNNALVEILNSNNYGDVTTTEDEAGGLVGQNNDQLIIQDSNNYGNIEGADHVGGLVGDTGNSNILTIVRSHNFGKVIGDQETGGLVGDSNLTTISDSINYGQVNADMLIGGIVGDNDGVLTLSAVTNNGLVSAGGSEVGGLVGQTDVKLNISNSHNNATITGINEVGGLVGKAVGDEDLISEIIISKSFNSGTIIGDNKIGGLVGDIGEDEETSTYIYQSFNSGDIYGTGDEGVGGIIGEVQYDLEIYQSYNSGSVILDSIDASEFRVGGIVGYIFSSNITFSGLINIGPVSGTAVSGTIIAGGLIGDLGDVTLGKIDYAYNIGLITADALNVSVGGLLGISNPGVTLENSYYLTGTALNAFDNGDSTLARVDTDIRNESEDWDSISYSTETGSNVNTIWIIDFSIDGINYVTYPWFPWMEEPIDALIIGSP